MERSHGFWAEAWRRYRCRPLAVGGLAFVGFLVVVAAFAPAIAGTKPVLCRYKGRLYAPCLGYFDRRLEPAIFTKDKFRGTYPRNLAAKDPDSWALWPLFFQDPYRSVRNDEWPGRLENPAMDQGRPSWNNLFGTDQAGVDVLAKMVHGTTVALLVGFVSMGIAGTIGVVVGAVGGYFGGWIDMLTSRVTEIVMCVPTLVLILSIVAIIEKPTIWHTMAIIGFTGWTGIAQRPGPDPGADHVRHRLGDPHRERAFLPGLRPATAVGQLGFGPQRRPFEPRHVVAGGLPRSRDLSHGARLQPDR